MKKLILPLFIICFSSLRAQMQKTLYYSPQFLTVNAVKLDLELKNTDKTYAFMISPYIQLGKTNVAGGASRDNNNYYSYPYGTNLDYPDDLVGVGAYFGTKLYLTEGLRADTKHNPYFSVGLSYLYSKISYQYITQESLINYNGNPSDIELSSGKDQFNILGSQIVMGDRLDFGELFALDLYTGVGLKYTDKSTTALGARNYNRSVFDYGYTGIHPVIGFRLGFNL